MWISNRVMAGKFGSQPRSEDGEEECRESVGCIEAE
jgi:hypothetical protein